MVDAAEGDGDVAGVGRDGELRHLDVESRVSAGEGGQAGRVARHGGAGVGPVRHQQPHPHHSRGPQHVVNDRPELLLHKSLLAGVSDTYILCSEDRISAVRPGGQKGWGELLR